MKTTCGSLLALKNTRQHFSTMLEAYVEQKNHRKMTHLQKKKKKNPESTKQTEAYSFTIGESNREAEAGSTLAESTSDNLKF